MPIVALLLFAMLHAAVNVVRPDWVRFHALMNVITRLGGLVLCSFLIKAGNLVVSANASQAAGHEHVVRDVNQTLYYCILFTAVISLLNLAKDIRRLLSAAPASSPAAST